MRLFIFVGSLLLAAAAGAQDVAMLKRIRECLGHETAAICLKESALDALNQTIQRNDPVSLLGFVRVVKDDNFVLNVSQQQEELPRDLSERNSRLNDLIYDKVEEYIRSRSVHVNLGNLFEGRAKKNKKGSMMMLGGLAMAGLFAQLFLGKIAFLAGAALLMAKMALLLSTVLGFKKLSGMNGGGGESSSSPHVVYAGGNDAGGYGAGHAHGGGGSWHRSIADNYQQQLPYKAHAPPATPGAASDTADGYAY